jgi:hypothetical protein
VLGGRVEDYGAVFWFAQWMKAMRFSCCECRCCAYDAGPR